MARFRRGVRAFESNTLGHSQQQQQPCSNFVHSTYGTGTGGVYWWMVVLSLSIAPALNCFARMRAATTAVCCHASALLSSRPASSFGNITPMGMGHSCRLKHLSVALQHAHVLLPHLGSPNLSADLNPHFHRAGVQRRRHLLAPWVRWDILFTCAQYNTPTYTTSASYKGV